MSRATRSSSASRVTMESNTQLSRQIPELFRTQRNSAQGSSQSYSTPKTKTSSPSKSSASSNWVGEDSPIQQHSPPLSLMDLEKIASDIKQTFTTAIMDLRSDVQAVAHRLTEVEQTAQTHAGAIRQVQKTYDNQLSHLFDLHRHVEDLDNRGRRHNVRIRGLPEGPDAGALQQTICAIFNELLDRPADSPIEMERAHRALRPQPRDSEPPRDVICCIVNFPLKEEILRRAREKGRVTHNGNEIKLFQDLSQITLQNRRALRPLLEILRSRNIQYRWKFPFGLSASVRGRSALLRTPEDIPAFCDQLDIPPIELPDWYSFYFPTEPWLPVTLNASPKAQRHRPRGHRADPIAANPRSSRRDFNQRGQGAQDATPPRRENNGE